MEVWGGIECTINRVGDTYFDQLEMTGHYARLDDLDRIAGLGIGTLRYPLLWEKTAPSGVPEADWKWADERLSRLRALNIEPIVTLLHHGSGPPDTDLLDDLFPVKLAEYALAVAQRYPWVQYYTPVNEPLTTARFSGLYGHWYPHCRDMASFFLALRNQCLGILLAMKAIRSVNRDAKLVMTEDFGKVHSTPQMSYQADFENERRWLSIDLLTGRVNQTHPLWSHLATLGVTESQVALFQKEPSVPDVVGINYYLTSERFLDERLEHYPSRTHGTNGQDHYADVEAVRVRAEGIGGVEQVVHEVWERYRLPTALTEVHLGGPCDDQIRWLTDAWQSALRARHNGIDIRAVTPWALFGSFDWHCLVTRSEGHYEPSAFDIRSTPISETSLAATIRAMQRKAWLVADALSPGWWRTDNRLEYPPVFTRQ
jgi:dTDP-4-dehydrorhamnose reductase